MNNYLNDNEYLEIVNDILNNRNYLKIKKYKHHGDNRFNHCVRVSYMAYKKAKKKDLKYREVARGALLHDFFYVNNQSLDIKTRLYVLKHHPEYALDIANYYFELTDLEKDIIISHMYRLNNHKPQYKESWLVRRVDKIVSVYDRIYSWGKIFKKQKNTWKTGKICYN